MFQYEVLGVRGGHVRWADACCACGEQPAMTAGLAKTGTPQPGPSIVQDVQNDRLSGPLPPREQEARPGGRASVRANTTTQLSLEEAVA
jgi:hypothetical protein